MRFFSIWLFRRPRVLSLGNVTRFPRLNNKQTKALRCPCFRLLPTRYLPLSSAPRTFHKESWRSASAGQGRISTRGAGGALMLCGKTCHTRLSPNTVGGERGKEGTRERGKEKGRRQPQRYKEGDVWPQTTSSKTAPSIHSPAQSARLLAIKACFSNVYISGQLRASSNADMF